MSKKLNKFKEKIKNSKLCKGHALSKVGACLIAVGVVGGIPSAVMGMPYISEKVNNSIELREQLLARYSDEFRISDASDILNIDMDANASGRLSVNVMKSDKEYSYIRIMSENSVVGEATVSDVAETKSSSVKVTSKVVPAPELKLKPGMNVDEFVQGLANNCMIGFDTGVAVEVYLAKPMEINLNGYCRYIEIDDGSLVSKLKSSTDDIVVRGENSINNLDIVAYERSGVNLTSEILANFKNINVSFNKDIKNGNETSVHIDAPGKNLDIPNVINVKADVVVIANSPYNIANEINLSGSSKVSVYSPYYEEIDNLKIKTMAVKKICLDDDIDVNMTNSMLVMEEESSYHHDYDKNYFTVKDNSFISIGEVSSDEVGVINILNKIDELSISSSN